MNTDTTAIMDGSITDEITLHGIYLRTLDMLVAVEGAKEERKRKQGELILAHCEQLEKRGFIGDAYKALAVQAERLPKYCKFLDYSADYYRDLASYRKLWGELGGPVGNAPDVSCSHYVAVTREGLGLDQKKSLLENAELFGWSVKTLKEYVKALLGVSGDNSNDPFIQLAKKAATCLNNLSRQVIKGHPVPARHLNILHFKVNKAIADYMAVFCNEAPPCQHPRSSGSAPSAVNITPATQATPDDPDPDGGAGAIITVQVGNELDAAPIVLDRDEFQQAA